MAGIAIQGNNSGSGSMTILGPDTNSALTLNVAALNGTLAPPTLETLVTATGSTIQFSNIPSWVNRITIMVNTLTYAAAAGGSQIRVGSGGTVESTGYFTTSSVGATHTRNTIGLGGFGTNSTVVAAGSMIITHMGNNIWVSQAIIARYSDTLTQIQCGTINLANTLDTIALVATTSSFASGSVNILYE